MAVVGVLMIGAGVFLVYEAWTSHKNQTPPAPITHATQAISTTAAQGVTGG